MRQVAKILGVELDEKFILLDLQDNECGRYTITREGLKKVGDDSHTCNDTFTAILAGYYTIKKLPWTPRIGQIYYYPALEARIAMWEGDETDMSLYTAGMVYKTASEAMDSGMKILKALKKNC